MADESACKATDGHGDKGNHRNERTGLEVEPANLGHVDEEPAEEDPRDISKGEITQGQRSHVAVADGGGPRNGHFGAAISLGGPRGLNEVQLVRRNERML